MNKVCLIYSGGMDSTTLMYDLKAQGNQVVALSFDYGQRHRRELESAAQICLLTSTEHHIMGLPPLPGSALTGNGDVPHGHYAEESMKQTVVPNRNMVMLAHAAAFAIANGIGSVAYAAHAGDHTIYPDCRPEFVEAMNVAFGLCDWNPVRLLAPYLLLTKGQIAARGKSLGVPFDLTWTCYEGGDEPCGRCGSCVERLEALAEGDGR